MILQFIFLPLFTLLIIGLLGRYIGNRGTFMLVITNFIILLLLSLYYLSEILLDNNIITINFDLANINIINTFPLNILIDDISIIMLMIILSITLIVLLYTYDYMINDPHSIRFYFYIILFVFFMSIFITSSYLPILFIG
jgi:NADH-quinone oxidoreductase subunit L